MRELNVLSLLDLLGVSVFAVSGALAAGRKHLDLLGVIVLALVTAVGGGTIRDLLLARHPIFWLANPGYLIAIVIAALATVVWTQVRRPPAAALLVADAIGLGVYSLLGAQIAERAGLPAPSCVLLGTVTGTAGGIVRDVLSAEIPLLLRRGNLYASAAIVGTTAYFILEALGTPQVPAAVAGTVTVIVLRLAAIWWGLALPVFKLEDE
jgi:uncharacterized membrane protein YeiH